MAAPVPDREIARELADYGVVLAPGGLAQLATYLELLLRWNRRVNLTAIREPREIVRRLFGESLFLAREVKFSGWLVDVGSGAGFPGLALKLLLPELRVSLIESRQKKGVFLKEVARACGFINVEVVVGRFESWAGQRGEGEKPDFITTRAVRITPELLATFAQALGPNGKLVLTTARSLAREVRRIGADWAWQDEIVFPQHPTDVGMIGSIHNS